jgi:hypothetical protein
VWAPADKPHLAGHAAGAQHVGGGEISAAQVAGHRDRAFGDDVETVVDLAFLNQHLLITEAAAGGDCSQRPELIIGKPFARR